MTEKCVHCGQKHETKCPLIKSIEYFEDGTTKKIEFMTPADYITVPAYVPYPVYPITVPSYPIYINYPTVFPTTITTMVPYATATTSNIQISDPGATHGY